MNYKGIHLFAQKYLVPLVSNLNTSKMENTCKYNGLLSCLMQKKPPGLVTFLS